MQNRSDLMQSTDHTNLIIEKANRLNNEGGRGSVAINTMKGVDLQSPYEDAVKMPVPREENAKLTEILEKELRMR